MRTLALFLIASALRAQAPISLSNPYISGVAQPSGVSVTVDGSNHITAITITASTTACSAAPMVTIFSSNGAGTGATATATCTNGFVDTPLTVTGPGSAYTTGQVFIAFGKALWNKADDHAHSIPTGGSSPACKTACAFACSGYATMALSEKLGNDSNYTTQDPGISCRTVTSGAGSCPIYNATTWNIATVTIGTGALLNVPHVHITANSDALAALLSTNNATATPIIITGSTGLTLSPAITGADASAGNALNQVSTNGYAGQFPWYATNVTSVAATSVDFDLYYSKVTLGVSAFVQVKTTGTPGGSPTLVLGGCGSTDTGTAGSVITTVPGYEAVPSDNHTLFAQNAFSSQLADQGGVHHGTAFNVSGSPIPTQTNDWLAAAKYALDNPAGGSPSAFTFSHPNYSVFGWSKAQLAYLSQLLAAYPGQLHMQVVDNQTGASTEADGAWDYALSTQNGPIWGNGSGDSYNIAIAGNSGIKGGGQYINYDSVSVPNIMDAINSGRSYFWGNFGSGTPRALRCGTTGLKIVCRSLTSEASLTDIAKTFIWIREGGIIARVTSSVVQDSYTVSGADGRYVRLMIINGFTGSYGVKIYVPGNNINNFYYPGEFSSTLWSQPFWISYGGTTGSSSTKIAR